MEASQILLICTLLVAGVYAGYHRSKSLKHSDTCNEYRDSLPGEAMAEMYVPCGVQNDDGKDLCYLSKHSKCDSVIDCKNFADERGCKREHKEECDHGLDGKVENGKPAENYTCEPFNDPEFDSDDRICIIKSLKCNCHQDCPQGDDELNCGEPNCE